MYARVKCLDIYNRIQSIIIAKGNAKVMCVLGVGSHSHRLLLELLENEWRCLSGETAQIGNRSVIARDLSCAQINRFVV